MYSDDARDQRRDVLRFETRRRTDVAEALRHLGERSTSRSISPSVSARSARGIGSVVSAMRSRMSLDPAHERGQRVPSWCAVSSAIPTQMLRTLVATHGLQPPEPERGQRHEPADGDVGHPAQTIEERRSRSEDVDHRRVRGES
jgi:hypothetical protein